VEVRWDVKAVTGLVGNPPQDGVMNEWGRGRERSDGCAGWVHVRGGLMDLALCMALLERGVFFF